MEKRRKISSRLIVLFFIICNESRAAVLRNPSDQVDNNSFTNQLVAHTKSKSCFFPFNETEVSGLFKDLDEACFVNSTPLDERKQLCVVFADLIDGICNKTEGYQQKNKPIKTENWTLFKNILENENNAPTFCENLITDINVPTADDVRKELKTFYEKFLSNTDKNTSCASICAAPSSVVAATASKSFKISPICLIFKYTSGVWKSLQETASSSAQENGKGQPEVVPPVAIESTNEINVVKKSPLSLPVQSSQSNVEENKDNLIRKPDISSSSTTAKDKASDDNYVKAPAENSNSLIGSSSSSSSPSPQIDVDSENIPPIIVGDAEKLKSSTASTPAKVPEKQSPPGMENSISVQDNNKPQQPSVVDKTPTKYEDPEDPGDTDYDSKAILPSDVGIDDITIPKESKDDQSNNIKPNKKPIEEEEKNNYRPDAPNTNAKTTFLYKTDNDEESTGYFNYFIFFLTLLALCFLALHNKRRLLAYVIEGRKPRGGRPRRRSASASGASYKRLENNFE